VGRAGADARGTGDPRPARVAELRAMRGAGEEFSLQSGRPRSSSPRFLVTLRGAPATSLPARDSAGGKVRCGFAPHCGGRGRALGVLCARGERARLVLKALSGFVGSDKLGKNLLVDLFLLGHLPHFPDPHSDKHKLPWQSRT
jgi:hypothetical protein